jgi:hypothetical protein
VSSGIAELVQYLVFTLAEEEACCGRLARMKGFAWTEWWYEEMATRAPEPA